MLQRERAREGKGWGGAGVGRACSAQTQIPTGMTGQCLATQSQDSPGDRNGDSRCDWWHKGTRNSLGHSQSAERTGRGWALRASTAGWRLSPLPGDQPTGTWELLFPQEWEFSWSRAPPHCLWDRNPPDPTPEFLLHKDSSHSAREPSTCQCWDTGMLHQCLLPSPKKTKLKAASRITVL